MDTTPTRTPARPPRYCVEQRDERGRCVAVVSGLGRNRGTWDHAANSLATARRWLTECRRANPGRRYAVAECV